jgi:hypothetical protein
MNQMIVPDCLDEKPEGLAHSERSDAWREKMALLESIHVQIDPELIAMRSALDDFPEFDSGYVAQNAVHSSQCVESPHRDNGET